ARPLRGRPVADALAVVASWWPWHCVCGLPEQGPSWPRQIQKEALMADQQSRGGKKEGTRNPEATEKHQTTGTAGRPAPGQPGGPKPNTGQSRPQEEKK